MSKTYLVRDYMTVAPIMTLSEDARLLEAALLMRRTGKRHIPVVTGEGKLVGILSDRDLARMSPSMLSNITAEEYNSIFENTPISKAMTANPLTVTPESLIQDAVSTLNAKKIGALPVVEGEKLVGILSVSDMLGLLHELLVGEGEPFAASAMM